MWGFVQISDPHLASHRDGEWNNRFLCSMMPELFVCLRRDLAARRPEFLLATGDICSRRGRDAMFEARAIMDSFGIPYYPIGGNHDFMEQDSREWFLEAFGDLLPDHRAFYSFTHKNLHFCMLEAWWQWRDGSLNPFCEEVAATELDMTLARARWALPPHVFEWLATDLDLHADMPTLLAVHYPAIGLPVRMRKPGYKDSGALENGDLLLDVLEAYPQVKAIFSGHMHLNYIERSRTITQVVTGALPEFPCEFREVLVYEDRLEVRTHSLSDPRFAARSLIPGKEWARGTDQDRSVVIPF